MSEAIGNGLEEQITDFKNEHYDLKVVFIDTLQKVRNESESGYGTDYVHHTRKCADSDPFNMISGSTGLSGCVDGSMVLIESKRGSRTAKLQVDSEINLQFDRSGSSPMSRPTVKARITFFWLHCMCILRSILISAVQLRN